MYKDCEEVLYGDSFECMSFVLIKACVVLIKGVDSRLSDLRNKCY